ncbi:MAG: copper chaperone PCu(A)C [Mycobacteriales bacterium]
MSHPTRLVASCLALAVAPFAIASCAAGTAAETSHEHTVQNGASANLGSIAIRDAFIVGPATTTAPLYVALFNSGPQPETLVTVSTTAAASVSLPGPSATVPLAAQNGSALLTSASSSLLLQGLTAPLVVGQEVPVTFTFATAGSITLTLPVESPTGAAPPSLHPSPAASGSASGSASASPSVGPSASASPSASPTGSTSPLAAPSGSASVLVSVSPAAS